MARQTLRGSIQCLPVAFHADGHRDGEEEQERPEFGGRFRGGRFLSAICRAGCATLATNSARAPATRCLVNTARARCPTRRGQSGFSGKDVRAFVLKRRGKITLLGKKHAVGRHLV